MNAQTQKRIDGEIEWLKANKQKIRRFTMFGDDNHASVDAQIRALEGKFTEEQIYDEWPAEDAGGDPANDGIRDSALSAINWRDGHERVSPSKNWQGLVQKKSK